MTLSRVSSNQMWLEEYALTTCVLDNDAEAAAKGEPKLHEIEKMGRVHILSQGIAAVAAFETVLFIKRNLKNTIEDEGRVFRLFSTPDVLIIVKHAMGLLKSVFKPYAERLQKLSAAQLREVCERIAGVCHRETHINILIGSGISLTGVSKLYYDASYLNKMEYTKLITGLDKGTPRAVFYISRGWPSLFHPSFPGLKEVEAVVGAIMGMPKQLENGGSNC